MSQLSPLLFLASGIAIQLSRSIFINVYQYTFDIIHKNLLFFLFLIDSERTSV